MPEPQEHLTAALGGSSEALGHLLELYRPYLRAQAEKALVVDLQAKVSPSDLIQETFAEVCQAFARFTGRTEGEFLAWLQQILIHKAVNLANHFRNTEKRRLDREVPLERVSLAENLAAGTPAPSVDAERREEAEILDRALKALPDDYRTVILLHHRDHHSFAETARRLGRSEAATRKLWARAVERWRREVEARYGPS